MAKYSTHACYKCDIRRPSNRLKRLEVKEQSGSGGFSASFSPFSKSRGKNLRVHSPRRYYSIRKKWVPSTSNNFIFSFLVR